MSPALSRALGLALCALLAASPERHSALAADPPPLIVAPGPAGPTGPTGPSAATPELFPATTPTLDCDALMPLVLAELDHFRAQLAGGAVLAQLAPEDRPRLAQVAAAVKEMKPAAAAVVVAGWDDGLATQVLARLPARSAGAIAAALPPELAARLLSRLSSLALEAP